ncbi:unnamed protein product, partial [Ixodes pacificus]
MKPPKKIPLYLWQQDMHTQIWCSVIVLLVNLAPWPSPLKARSHLRLATAARLTSDVRQATTDAYAAGDLRVASRKLSGCPVDSVFPATAWVHVLLLSYFRCPTATGVPLLPYKKRFV